VRGKVKVKNVEVGEKTNKQTHKQTHKQEQNEY
jgi:hypothetical protein